jgi:hypothetical protein
MADIVLADGTTIHATAGHPFWDATIHAFVNAGDLTVGDQVLTADGALLAVTGVYLHQQDLTAYNLSISDIHTYYAGDAGVLVHNTGGTCELPADGSRMTVNEALDAGENWLGPEYREAVPGSGRFISADGKRVVRMGESDITGAHGGGATYQLCRARSEPGALRPPRRMAKQPHLSDGLVTTMIQSIEVGTYDEEKGLHLVWTPDFLIEVVAGPREVTIKANRAGLRTLAAHLLALAGEDVPPGVHIHLEPGLELEPESSPMVFDRIEE